MAQQTINVATPGSGLGDSIRAAFEKVNANFLELYATKQTANLLKAFAFKDTIAGSDIPNDAVTFAKMQNIATARLLGRNSGGSGDIEELTGAIATGLLNNFIADNGVAVGTKGLVPASAAGDMAAGKVLLASGLWGWQNRNLVQNVSTAQPTHNTTTFATTGMQDVITLRKATSRVRVRFMGGLGASVVGAAFFDVRRNGTSLIPAGTTEIRSVTVPSNLYVTPLDIELIDSPGTIGPITYTLWWKVDAGLPTVYLGRRGADTTHDQPFYIILEEIET